MTEIIQTIFDWIQINPNWAGWVLFSVALLESLAVIGMLVPGVAIMFGIGALIGLGILDFYAMVIWSFLGAVLGDGLSYGLGYYYRHQIYQIWPLSRYPRLIQEGEQFFQQYGQGSVVLGRFIGPIRAVIPLVAGIMNMTPRPFFMANIISALIWAPAYLLPGILFAQSLDLAKTFAYQLSIVIILLVVFVLLLIKCLRVNN